MPIRLELKTVKVITSADMTSWGAVLWMRSANSRHTRDNDWPQNLRKVWGRLKCSLAGLAQPVRHPTYPDIPFLVRKRPQQSHMNCKKQQPKALGYKPALWHE